MRVLIYISHPAQFHFFKFIIKNLTLGGCKVQLLIKTKDVLEQLVKAEGLDYINIQPVVRKNSVASIAFAQIIRTLALIKIARTFKPAVMLGTDASVAQAGWLLRIPVLTTLEDDIDVIPKLANLTYPFTTRIVVPDVCSVGRWEKKKTGYKGYMKLAYLHPDYFLPDRTKTETFSLGKKYCLIRLAKLTAHHDVGQKEFKLNSVLRLINIIHNRGFSVFISSESDINKNLEKYRLNIGAENIHHALYFSSLLISDSQSMSMEAAMLGVPSVRFSNFTGRISVLEELEHKYKLTYGIRTENKDLLYKKVDELLSTENLEKIFRDRREIMLKDKTDVTAYFTHLIQDYCSNNQ